MALPGFDPAVTSTPLPAITAAGSVMIACMRPTIVPEVTDYRVLTELRLPTIKRLWTELATQSDREGWRAERLLSVLFEHEMAGLDARHEVQLGEAGGSHTDAVRPVQRALNRLLGLRIPEDGMETPETRSAIRSFEKRLRLPVTGRVTPGVIAALRQALGRRGAVGGAFTSAIRFSELKATVKP